MTPEQKNRPEDIDMWRPPEPEQYRYADREVDLKYSAYNDRAWAAEATKTLVLLIFGAALILCTALITS